MANSAIVGTLRAVLSADTAEFASAMKKAGDTADQTAADMIKAAGGFKELEVRASAITRLMKDFSGSFETRAAKEWAVAIESIGGAAKLSERELRSASGVFQDYISKAQAMGHDVPQEIRKVANEIEKLTSVSKGSLSPIDTLKGAFQNLGPSITAAATGFAAGLLSVEAFTRGLRLAVDFVKDSIDAYAQAEKANRKLTAALEAQGQATPKTVQAYKDLADQFQRTTVFQDDLITEMETLLVQVGNVMPNQMEKALDSVTNLASGLGIDLRSATLMVAKAAEDNFTALQKQGVQIDVTRAKAEGFDYILGQINKRFGGQAAADMQTFDGQLKNTANQFDELKETIGGVIVKSAAFQAAFFLLRVEIEKTNAEIKGILGTMKILASIPGPVGESFRFLVADLNHTTKSVGQVQQAMADWQGPIQDTTAKLPKLTGKIKENTKAIDDSEKAYRDWADSITGGKLLQDLATLETRLARLTREGGLNERAMMGIAEEADKLQKQGMKLSPQLQDLWLRFVALRGVIQQGTASLPPFSKALTVTGDEMRQMADKDLADLNKKLQEFQKIISTGIKVPKGGEIDLKTIVAPPDTRFLSVLKGELGDVAGEFPDMIAKAILHGEDIGKAFHALFVDIGGDLGKIFGSSLAKEGSKASGILGNVFGALGAIGADALVKVFGAISKASRNTARDMQDAFATTELGFQNLAALNDELKRRGAFDLVNRGDRAQRREDEGETRKWMDDVRKFLDDAKQKAAELEQKLSHSFDGLSSAAAEFGGKAPKALQPIIQELLGMNGLTEDQKKLLGDLAGAPEWQVLQGIADSYGIKLSALGPKFEQARLGDIAMHYARDFITLTDAGADVEGVLTGMQDEVQTLVNDALRAGVTLPEAFRPVLQKLVDMGKLTDENGDKLENLDRFKFSGDFEDVFKNIKTILEEIRDLLKQALPDAAKTGAKGIDDAFRGKEINIPVKWHWGDMAPPEGFDIPVGAPRLQHGGITKPGGLTPAILHPNEAVIPLDQLGANEDRYVIYLDNYIDGRKVTESVLLHTREVARRIGVRPI